MHGPAAVCVCAVAIFTLVACHRAEAPDTGPAEATATYRDTPITYEVRAVAPQPVRSRVPTQIKFSVVRSDGVPASLQQTYDSYVHVLAVSRDLRWYSHLHIDDAQVLGDKLPLTFPHDGDYVLFAYFQPAGAMIETRAIPMTVGHGPSHQAVRPIEPTALIRDVRDYRVEMEIAPRPLWANVWQSLTFHMSHRGDPVTNLGSEGQLGHLAIVSEGAHDFVFAHSTVEEAGGIRSEMHVPAHPTLPDEPKHALQPVGPQVTFHARFAHPGRYKLWAEFRPLGDDVMAEFVVTVQP